MCATLGRNANVRGLVHYNNTSRISANFCMFCFVSPFGYIKQKLEISVFSVGCRIQVYSTHPNTVQEKLCTTTSELFHFDFCSTIVNRNAETVTNKFVWHESGPLPQRLVRVSESCSIHRE